MCDNGYLVKFNNFKENPNGTGKLHYQVLKEYGKVLWGQWSANGNIMSQTTYDRMNNEVPFYLYAFDKNTALLKMKVDQVLYKDEVINQSLEYLIPSYYSIDTPCTNYYLISKIEILPAISAQNLITANGNNVYDKARNVNSCSPWNVFWGEEVRTQSSPEIIEIKEIVCNKENNDDLLYTIYCYTSKTTGKEYIGMTNNISRRIAEHSNISNWQRERKKYLYTMFTVLGYDDFDLTILHQNLSENEAHYWEAKEIEQHNCYWPNGLNERNESHYLHK